MDEWLVLTASALVGMGAAAHELVCALCGGAPCLRRRDRRLPGRGAPAGRRRHRLDGARASWPRRRPGRSTPVTRAEPGAGRHGLRLRVRDRRTGHVQRHPLPRRLRVHARARCRSSSTAGRVAGPGSGAAPTMPTGGPPRRATARRQSDGARDGFRLGRKRGGPAGRCAVVPRRALLLRPRGSPVPDRGLPRRVVRPRPGRQELDRVRLGAGGFRAARRLRRARAHRRADEGRRPDLPRLHVHDGGPGDQGGRIRGAAARPSCPEWSQAR